MGSTNTIHDNVSVVGQPTELKYWAVDKIKILRKEQLVLFFHIPVVFAYDHRPLFRK